MTFTVEAVKPLTSIRGGRQFAYLFSHHLFASDHSSGTIAADQADFSVFTVTFGSIKPELQTTPTRAFACADARVWSLPIAVDSSCRFGGFSPVVGFKHPQLQKENPCP
ncbi:MAG TPA: hypothetical protein H9961_05040 [Candidatus Duodenibacillus intestinavium]|nr:hypothetical protein [Candidatus Duodenibacillus intestinavium]